MCRAVAQINQTTDIATVKLSMNVNYKAPGEKEVHAQLLHTLFPGLRTFPVSQTSTANPTLHRGLFVHCSVAKLSF